MHARFLLSALALLLTACASAPASEPAPEPAPAPQAAPMEAPLNVIFVPMSDDIDELLAYHDLLRRMSHPDLADTLQALELEPENERLALQKAMLLGILQGDGQLVRAQRLAESVVTAQTPDAEALRPLAGLLAAHYAELRRLSEQAARLHQQNREYVRRVGQLSKTLEDLKAIERMLPTGPAAQAPAMPPGK